MPLINKTRSTEVWASRGGTGEIIYHHKPEYHGNPVDAKGSLVTMQCRYDLASFISEKANTPTVIIAIDNIDLGIRAEYIDVVVNTRKQ